MADENSQTFTWTSDMSKLQSEYRQSAVEAAAFFKKMKEGIKISEDGTPVYSKMFDAMKEGFVNATTDAKLFEEQLAKTMRKAKEPMPLFEETRAKWQAAHREQMLAANRSDVAGTDSQIGRFGALSGGSAGGSLDSEKIAESTRLHKEAFLEGSRNRRAEIADIDKLVAEKGREIQSREANARAAQREAGQERVASMIRNAQSDSGRGKARFDAVDAEVVKQVDDAKKSLATTNRQLLHEEKAEVETIRQLKKEHKEVGEFIAQRANVTNLANQSVTTAISQEAQWRYELAEVSRQIEVNRKKIADLATTEVGTAQQRKQASLVLHEANTKLSSQQQTLTRQVEGGTKGLLGNRDAMRQLTYGVQDFVSGGGMHNIAMGMRGVANNAEMMAMSLGKNLSPMQLMGVALIPTAALAVAELAVGFKNSADTSNKAAEAMGRYEEYVKRTRDEVVDLTTKENEREINRARREAAAAGGEGVAADKKAWEDFRAIEHNMNVYSGKEQPRGLGDRIGSGVFALTAIARRAAKNAGQIGGDIVGGLGGNRGALWNVDTVHEQLADAELKVRGVRSKQTEGAQASIQKDQLLGVRRDVRNEIDRRNKELELKGESKHVIEKDRDEAIADRHGRPLRKRDQRDFEMRLKSSEDEMNRLRDQIKRLESTSKDNPALPLADVLKAIGERAAPNSMPARLPNLGNVPLFFNPMGN